MNVVNVVNVNAAVAATRSAAVARIVSLLKAMRGQITGDYVFYGSLLDRSMLDRVTTIECRMPLSAIHHVASILAVDYRIEFSHTEHVSDYEVRRFVVRLPYGSALVLNVTETKNDRACFDVDALSASHDRVMVRPLGALRNIFDRFEFVITRIRSRTFCNLDTTPDIASCVRRAVDMVQRDGWLMDDALLGRRTWVVFRWSNAQRVPSVVRVCDDPSNPSIVKHDVCAICQQNISPDHIVVNLACNHNFHWQCPQSNGDGLCKWFDKTDTCPCCRSVCS